jgi:5'-nucleotidase
MIIGFDVDSVLAMTCFEWLRRYNVDYDDNLTPDDITSWDTHKFVKPACGFKIYDYLVPDLYDNVQPYPGAVKTVNLVRRLGFRVVFVTSVNQEYGAKYYWLLRNDFFNGVEKPKKDYVETGDKTLVQAMDYLVDDSLDNIYSVYNTRMTKSVIPIIFNQPWNQNAASYGLPNSINRVFSHEELQAYFAGVSSWQPLWVAQ